jgi:hypothetical protein
LGRFDTIRSFPCRGLGLAVALLLTLALSGCGGVEFKGKVFDYMGVSGSGTQEDVRMSQRAPLILPPDTDKLPQPGQGVTAAARPDWPADADRERKRAVAAKEVEQQEKAAEADPINPYAGKPNLFDKLLGRKPGSDEIELVDVPEPDPSDKTPEDRAREQNVVASTAPKPLTPSVVDDEPAQPDPFHTPAPTPKSYEQMSNPQGNRTDY